ncbi:MAG: hypothetical protein HXY21_01410, partial [Parvularculaceae bacterium]|nr:hypothetical protein [Parvularculaceae bacterium]
MAPRAAKAPQPDRIFTKSGFNRPRPSGILDPGGLRSGRFRAAGPLFCVGGGVFEVTMMLRLAAALLCGTTVLAAMPSYAQQQIDEPRLDPIFGEKRPSTVDDRPRVTSDDEFDHDKKWHPLRDFVGVFTFLAPSNTDLSIGVGPE